ncbi:YdeI/OmpD-associated family protein [Paenibacillus xylanexedens]|uniref:YdeI/OmpD-associated family protein n=1 Tax=Paenibacillus xylanexedens TaxID=528191 RepID=UPI003D0356CA
MERDCELTKDYKWIHLCYTLNGKNIKDYYDILFIKDFLLKNTLVILIQQKDNVQAGLLVEKKRTERYTVPEELQQQFDENPAFQAAFEALTPGRQRAYLYYFSQPKQSKTKVSRIEKYMQPIMEGKGMLD